MFPNEQASAAGRSAVVPGLLHPRRRRLPGWLALAISLALTAATMGSAGCRKTAPASSATPTKDEFAAIMVEAFGERHKIARYDAAQFALDFSQGDGGDTNVLFLRNAYDEYCAAPASARHAVVLQYAKDANERTVSAATLDSVRARLLPIVREGLYFENVATTVALEHDAGSWSLPHRAIGGVMHEGVAIDSEGSIQPVTTRDLDKWSARFEDLRPVAIANLRLRSGEAFLSPQAGVYVSPWRDNYDASRILLVDVVRRLDVHGAPVAMVPSRDVLIITGDQDLEGLAKAADLAEETLAKPRAMNALALRLEADSWVPFLPGKPEALRRRFARIAVTAMNDLYRQQKELLDRANTRQGQDIFVATFTALERKADDEVTSSSVWSKDVPTLLPRTDKIGFVDPDLPKGEQVLGFASWERVQTVVPGLLVPQAMSPERYRVEAFPSPEQLRKLGLTADPFSPRTRP